MNFQFPKRLYPWSQAANPTTPHFDSESESDDADEDIGNFDGSVVEIEEIVVDNGEVSSGIEESTSSREGKKGSFE